MPLYGKIVVIKRSGADGAHFPLTASSCLFGRSNDCDIRIQLPNVSKEHCRIDVNQDGEIFLTNLSQVNPTLLNGLSINQTTKAHHMDVFTIIDRSFRFEFPPGSPYRTTKILTPNRKIQTPRGTPSSTPKAAITPKSMKKTPGSPKRTPLKVLSPKVEPQQNEANKITTPKGRTPIKSSKGKTPVKSKTPSREEVTAMKVLSPTQAAPLPAKGKSPSSKTTPKGKTPTKTPKVVSTKAKSGVKASPRASPEAKTPKACNMPSASNKTPDRSVTPKKKKVPTATLR